MKSEKYDISLCKLDVDVKNQMVVIDSVGLFNLTRNSLEEKFYFIASSTLIIK